MSDSMRQVYKFTPEGIRSMSEPDAIMTCATLMGHNEDEDQTNSLITAIQLGFRSNGKIDFENAYEIIYAFNDRFQSILKGETAKHVGKQIPNHFTGKDNNGKPMEYEEWRCAKDLANQNMPKNAFVGFFEKYLFGDWINRKQVVNWFHKHSQIPDDTAPTEIKGCQYGNGLFATRDIKKGELIAYYPMDWVSDSRLCPTDDNKEKYSADQQKWICIQNAGIIGYGNPYDEQGNPERIMKELRDAEGRMTHRINDYGFSFSGSDGYVHIWGDPLSKQPNHWFRGCIANDGAYFVGQTPKGYREEYYKMMNGKSDSKCNCQLSTRMVASRDIKKGEEILTVYGESYWFGGAINPNGDVAEVDDDLNYNTADALTVRDAFNKMSKGQKKKAKANKKAMREGQDNTFKTFREKLADSDSNPDKNKWRVCICEVNQKENSIDVSSVICSGTKDNDCVDGDPIQFSRFY